MSIDKNSEDFEKSGYSNRYCNGYRMVQKIKEDERVCATTIHARTRQVKVPVPRNVESIFSFWKSH